MGLDLIGIDSIPSVPGGNTHHRNWLSLPKRVSMTRSSQRDRFIHPFTDYGFKRLFGEEPNKDLLLDFLNELLHEQEGQITDLTYLKSEQLGNTTVDRKAVFDLYCLNEKGERFIVELQKTKQNFFKDRTLYYSTFPIQEQAQKADWNFELKAVYTVAILDFVFEEDKDQPDKYRYDVKLSDINTHRVFYNKLTFIYLEMPKFRKSLAELETRFEKWLYVLRNLDRLDSIPEALRERVFEKLFQVAEIAQFTREEYLAYEDSLKYYRDLKNSLDTARDEGVKQEKDAFIQGLLQKGVLSIAEIAELARTTVPYVEEIQKRLP